MFPDHKYDHVHKWVQSTVIWDEGTLRKCVSEDPNYSCGMTQIHKGGWLGGWATYNGDVSAQEIKAAYKKDLKLHDAKYHNEDLDNYSVPILDDIMRAFGLLPKN